MTFLGWMAAFVLFYFVVWAGSHLGASLGMHLGTPPARFDGWLIATFAIATISFVVVSYLIPAKRRVWVTLVGCLFLWFFMLVLFIEMHNGPAYSVLFIALAAITAVAMRFKAPREPEPLANDAPDKQSEG